MSKWHKFCQLRSIVIEFSIAKRRLSLNCPGYRSIYVAVTNSEHEFCSNLLVCMYPFPRNYR
uniref:Uncharacterized protein n=1 Tax=Picea glauca TaxID=3330 RepID=A0A101M455_PICGL|nr:hypothetical protein ABT39_MTgene333 [Picea glauca]